MDCHGIGSWNGWRDCLHIYDKKAAGEELISELSHLPRWMRMDGDDGSLFTESVSP